MLKKIIQVTIFIIAVLITSAGLAYASGIFYFDPTAAKGPRFVLDEVGMLMGSGTTGAEFWQEGGTSGGEQLRFSGPAVGKQIHLGNSNGDFRVSGDSYNTEIFRVFSNGDMKVARNLGVGTNTSIRLAVGDSDTGLNQNGDGHLQLYANNVAVMEVTSNNVAVSGNFSAADGTFTGNVTGGLLASKSRIQLTGGTSGGYWNLEQISDGSFRMFRNDSPAIFAYTIDPNGNISMNKNLTVTGTITGDGSGLTNVLRSSDLAGYATTASLANYATTAALNSGLGTKEAIGTHKLDYYNLVDVGSGSDCAITGNMILLARDACINKNLGYIGGIFQACNSADNRLKLDIICVK